MSDKDFETIYAITLEAPNRIGTMIASTPTGRRGMFYKTCKEMPFNLEDDLKPINTKKGFVYNPNNYNREFSEGWKEFYFPTMVNPEWSEKMERELKGQFSEVAYEHEVLAEFGTETIGVFNKEFIDEASSVAYPMIGKRIEGNNNEIAIGVDWDKILSTLREILSTKYRLIAGNSKAKAMTISIEADNKSERSTTIPLDD